MSTVEDNRTILWWLPQWGDAIWVSLYSFSGAIIVRYWPNNQHRGIAITITVIILYTLCWLALIKGAWLPLIPSILALFSTAVLVNVYTSRLSHKMKIPKI